MHVVATAGHVDHGKSTIVHALTGMDPDRWAEEKARGLTIDLGFAWTTLPSGRELAFVDVPGHVRFLRNMLAGVGAVDACLFVVAATEGWKPQSEEHLRILELLGVSHGVVALTKAGLVDEDDLELARLDVAEHLAGTFLDGAHLVSLDAPNGRGLDALTSALDVMLEATPLARDVGRPRLWVDRSFAPRGAGTVVTGTLTGGTVAVDDELVLLPSARRVRVRGLQSHASSLPEASPGRRLAVNLGGVAHDEVARGDALVRAHQWAPTRIADCSLGVLPSLDHAVARRGAFAMYIGSGEHSVQLRVLGSEAIEPGACGAVRLRFPTLLPLMPGDRYVLRESGRNETVGGGEVLDVAPVLAASRAAPNRSVDRVVRERGWVHTDELARLTGERRDPNVGNWVVDPEALAEARSRVRSRIDGAGPLGLDVAELDERERALVASLPGVEVRAGRARPAEAVSPLANHPFVMALEANPFAPPSPSEVDKGELRELVRSRLVVERDGLYFSPAAIAAAASAVARMLSNRQDGFTVSELRETLGTTRKFLLPILAELDATGVTRRRGDRRIGGPRLPPPPPPSPS